MSSNAEKMHDLKARRMAQMTTSTDLNAAATKDVAAALNGILADAFALYLKTKNFHWHMTGRHFVITICCWMNRRARFLR